MYEIDTVGNLLQYFVVKHHWTRKKVRNDDRHWTPTPQDYVCDFRN